MEWLRRKDPQNNPPAAGEAEAVNEASPVLHGFCPECGIDLSGVNIRAHLGGHWDKEPHPIQHKRAFTKYHALLAWAEDQEGGGE